MLLFVTIISHKMEFIFSVYVTIKFFVLFIRDFFLFVSISGDKFCREFFGTIRELHSLMIDVDAESTARGDKHIY